MLYWTIKLVLTPIMRLAFRITVEGRERIPKSGPVILAANHRSFLDSLFIPLVLRRRVTFVAKAEYFDDPKSAWFFRGVGQIPIRREGGSASERALESAAEVLERGGVFAIYPEGTRTRDGDLHRGRTGVGRLALRTGAPIVPVGLVGTDEAQPVNRRMPKIGARVTLRFGEPIDPTRLGADPLDRAAARSLTDEIMFEIHALCGRYTYVDEYASRDADEAPAEVTEILPRAA